jgi:hypothetical protein
VDVLFALDGSGSMYDEISALSATPAFTDIVDAITGMNCGATAYRIAVTDDHDGGFKVPNGWGAQAPWFDSTQLSKSDLVSAFSGAAGVVAGRSGTPIGCEHVLSTAVDQLKNDGTGFLRPDALLVLVLLTDVDDYGTYDNVNGNSCGVGCNIVGAPVADLYNSLTSLKGGAAAGVSAIVIAGDPNVAGGTDFCGRPGTCCSAAGDCMVTHADRLWSFVGMQANGGGYTANVCTAPVPDSVRNAFETNIATACEAFDPPP